MSSIPRTSGIYQILCVPTGKVYIGSAVNLAARFQEHRTKLRGGRHENAYLQNAWNKYGEDAFEFVVLELILAPFLLEREQYWLDKLRVYDRRRGFNISLKASAPMTGRKHSPDTLARMSQASTGRTQTEETRRRKSEALKGRVMHPITDRMREIAAAVCRERNARGHTEETKQKLSEIAKRRPPRKASDETRAKMRIAALEREARKRQRGQQ